ncbi:hypothetical protein [Pelagibius sp.]|uniref:hypothetical protein n=1 Tax=Pelagibius sp. TaxID=1931238 RepID=UPI0026167CEB|nr:hypothetical protein [Pelagibius sp.]
MPTYKSWFRPWLDDPGPWEAWRLETEEETAVAAALQDAAGPAEATLHGLFGDQADVFGGRALVQHLAHQPAEAEPLFRAALAIAALDHYRARVAVPRAEPGGSTNPANRDRWAVLRPYLIGRVQHGLQSNAADSLLWRAILGRVADNWVPTALIGRRLERHLMESGLFTSVAVDLDLRPPVPGGRVWLRGETAKTLETVKASLARRQPVLVELLRDPLVSPAAAQWVVVYRMETAADGWTTLACYDPALGAAPLSLRLRLEDDALTVREPSTEEAGPAVKALRAVTYATAAPPLFGLRRWLRWVLPWGLFWYLKRRWQVFRSRKKGEKGH